MNKYRVVIQTGLKFSLLFVVLLTVQFIFGVQSYEYWGDAYEYYQYGCSMLADGKISLASIASDFRGYVFPSYMAVCAAFDVFFGITNAYWYLSSALLSILFCVYIHFLDLFWPMHYNTKYERLHKFICEILPICIVLFFNYGLIVYPLTDLYAALLIVTSFYALFKGIEKHSGGLFFLSGLFAYFTYNIRTIYLLSAAGFIYVFVRRYRKRIKVGLTKAMFFCGGILCGGGGQLYLNLLFHKKISIMIETQSLFSRQLFWGIDNARYATFCGAPEVHTAAMHFYERTGSIISNYVAESGMSGSIFSYIKLVLKFPLEFLGIYGRHLINAIFVIYPETYIQNIDQNRFLYSILSLVIVYLFIICLKNLIELKQLTLDKMVLLLGIVLPDILILAGAVEERFLVLPYMMIYGFLARYGFWKELIQKIKTRWLYYIAGFVVFSAIALAVETEIIANLEYTGAMLDTFSGLF